MQRKESIQSQAFINQYVISSFTSPLDLIRTHSQPLLQPATAMPLGPVHVATALASSYMLASALLFHNPHWIHTPHRPSHPLLARILTSARVLRIAHRGGARNATQNTIQAFKKCLPFTDMLQMDVMETKDGVLVVHHDRSLKRTCGVEKLVAELEYAQLPRYQDEVRMDFSEGGDMKTNNERIPRLEEVLGIFAGVPMDIELKTPTPRAIENFVKLIHEHGREQYTIVGIRGKQHDSLAEHYRKLAPSDPSRHLLTFFPDHSALKLYLAYFLGYLPFVPLRDQSLQLPIYSHQFESWCRQRARDSNQSQLRVIIGCRMLKMVNWISGPLVRHLRKRGVMTYGWVCNTEDGVARALGMGVQGVMGDDLGDLGRWLGDRGRDEGI